MKDQGKNIVEIKPYLTGELARFYQVSKPTLRKWLKRIEEKIGERNGRYYSIKQVEVIFQEFGLPKTMNY